MTGQSNSRGNTVLADARVTLRVPVEKAEAWLVGTEWEGQLGSLDELARERIGEILEERISEDFVDLLDSATGDAEVEVDW